MTDTTLRDEPAPRLAPESIWTRLIEPRVLGPIVGAAAVALALFIIHEVTRDIHLHEIGAALRATTFATVAPAVLLTIVSFAAMSLYDVLAVRHVAPGKVPLRLASFAGLVGYGISNAIGFHVFVGGPLRYRIYQTVGLDAADVGRIVGVSVMTFSAGLAALAGTALLLDPSGVPALHLLSATDDRLIGGAVLAVLAVALLWLARGPRTITAFGWSFTLPPAGSVLVQILIGAVDIGAAAGALYLLLPADVAPGYAAFLLIFVAAIIAGIVSHAPGGLGVLEAGVLLGLGAGARPDVVAALVVFRVVYYFLPLALAALAYLAFEAWRARLAVGSAAGHAFALTRRIIPPIVAALVFLGGVVLLVSGNTPAEVARTSWLSGVLPLPFAEASHLLASLTGLLLIVLSRGLYRKMATARLMVIALLLAGAAFSMLKGVDWEEAGLLVAIAAVLYIYRAAFYRRGDWRSFRPTPTWIALMAIVVVSLTLIGFLAYRHVDYQADLWWRFSWSGDAPRFLRATLATGAAAAAIAIDALINRPARRQPTSRVHVPAQVRTILAGCAGTQPNVALLGDKSFILSDDGKAFIMYSVAGSSWITMGDPVGERKPAAGLIWRFAEAADRAGAKAVFYAVQPQFLPEYLDLGLAILKIGEVARVDLKDFTLAGAPRQPLRYAHGRAEREGLVFAIIDKADIPEALPQLRAVSDDWLAGKTGHEKGFSLGRFDEPYMKEFDCAVLRKDGEIVAFANLWRGGDGQELSIDLMRYRHGVSKVMMDALFVHIMLYGREAGYRWFNLGAAPLAGLADHPLASTWNRVGTFIFRRGDEFYNFAGLRAFKQKFDPVWTPQYIASPGGIGMPRALIDVTTLISGSPMGVLKR